MTPMTADEELAYWVAKVKKSIAACEADGGHVVAVDIRNMYCAKCGISLKRVKVS